MKQPRQHNGVAQAAYREELGDALQDGDNDGLNEIHGELRKRTPPL
jgi:hypothetical protein